MSHIIWRIRYRKLRKEAKSSGKSIDDMLDSMQGDSQEQDLSEVSKGSVASGKPDDVESQMPKADAGLPEKA